MWIDDSLRSLIITFSRRVRIQNNTEIINRVEFSSERKDTRNLWRNDHPEIFKYKLKEKKTKDT